METPRQRITHRPRDNNRGMKNLEAVIIQAIRDTLRAAVKLGEMTDTDDRYILSVLAPSAANIAVNRYLATVGKKRGDEINSPYGDASRVRLLSVTHVGIAFLHPKRGHCGMRFDSMTPAQKKLLDA